MGAPPGGLIRARTAQCAGGGLDLVAECSSSTRAWQERVWIKHVVGACYWQKLRRMARGAWRAGGNPVAIRQAVAFTDCYV